MIIDQNDIRPYDMPSDEREAIRNGDVKGKKWVNKTLQEIWPSLWPTIVLAYLPHDENTGTITIMNRLLHFDKIKKTLKSKDDKGITHAKAVNLCLKHYNQLQRQSLRQKSLKELVAIVIGVLL